MSGGKLIIKPWLVSVRGFDSHTYHAPSRGKALAAAFNSYQAHYAGSFKDFLRIANAIFCISDSRFGEQIEVCKLPAFYVSHNRQYIQFVRPDSDVILNSHPLDVEPPEARRGTPYYRQDA